MDLRQIILNLVEKQGEARASEVIKKTGFSRTYVNRFFQQLRDEGLLLLIGKANKARYIHADNQRYREEMNKIKAKKYLLINKGLEEDDVLTQIKKQTGIFEKLESNVKEIVEYAFLEMVNNAIEHSHSNEIEIEIAKEGRICFFKVKDKGIGIFNNIKEKKNLPDDLSAIQELLKGKTTTLPNEHSGEGIFFTSKLADLFIIRSNTKKVIFSNIEEDLFIKDIKRAIKGTQIYFAIALKAETKLEKIFSQYADETYTFSKTKATIKIYKQKGANISRSQARRLVSGLHNFKNVELDFSEVETVGQAFADEVFRIWHTRYPQIDIVYTNANENIVFMIERAKNRTYKK